ncbi:MAG: heparinase II/III family protein [Alphaproteobacteria bacterium]|nr:heparinase II/III family protein [Alphaproteobacteria bacterium]MBL7098614.1 heparinase II/III family protein [Alphaproteobacteria bacterium]
MADASQRVPYLKLLPELSRAVLWWLWTPFRVWYRRTWLYRRLLKGALSDRILFHPYDATPRKLEDADALLRGRFRFHGEMVEAREGSVFDMRPPSLEWAKALHSFAWLPPLALAGGEPARVLAMNLMTQWLKRHSKYSEPAWSPDVMARRLIHLFAHGRLMIANSELMWRSKVFVSLREQSRMLARIAQESPDGICRFEAAAAYALSGACLGDSQRRLEEGLKCLEGQIARQILPDGGHISRSPEQLLNAYRLIMMVMDALNANGLEVPHAIRSGYDRIAPMIRFFRHGDGALALFNGGTECDPRTVAGLLARDEVRGQPYTYARHSAYQRMTAGKTMLLLDCGSVPPGPFSDQAHAGCLALELSSGSQRIIVNCGAAGASQPRWESALRATAAHSTLVLADASMAMILPPGLARNLLGARMLKGPEQIETRRVETTQGWSIEASHDGYVEPWGIRHEREVTLSQQGLALTGVDRLLPQQGNKHKDWPFAIRFHVHPDIRMSPSQGGGILLKLPTGEGWRFRSGASATIEESVYLGSEQVRRAEQIVLTGAVKDQQVDIAWVFEQIGALSS